MLETLNYVIELSLAFYFLCLYLLFVINVCEFMPFRDQALKDANEVCAASARIVQKERTSAGQPLRTSKADLASKPERNVSIAEPHKDDRSQNSMVSAKRDDPSGSVAPASHVSDVDDNKRHSVGSIQQNSRMGSIALPQKEESKVSTAALGSRVSLSVVEEKRQSAGSIQQNNKSENMAPVSQKESQETASVGRSSVVSGQGARASTQSNNKAGSAEKSSPTSTNAIQGTIDASAPTDMSNNPKQSVISAEHRGSVSQRKSASQSKEIEELKGNLEQMVGSLKEMQNGENNEATPEVENPPPE